nr:hypothetical protein [Acidobacteriota bacterium]
MKITFLFVALAAAALVPVPSQEAELSPTVLAQIAALEREKASRSPVQRRIDSQLLLAQQSAVGRAVVPGLRASVTPAADGRQLLDVRADMRAGLADAIRALGADVLDEDIRHRALRVQARLDQVEAIAAVPGVQFVAPLRGGFVAGYAADRIAAPRATGLSGSVNSQGDVTHAAS